MTSVVNRARGLSNCGEDALSGVIYAAIVAMWAVVLVPMVLRRHDSSVESRSVDRFSSAMRVLSRRSRVRSDSRHAVTRREEEPEVPDGLDVHVAGSAAPGRARQPRQRRVPAATAPRRDRRSRPGRPGLLAKRRRLALLLTVVTLLTVVLAVWGVLGWIPQLVVDVVLVGYLVHLRGEARRAAAASRQRRRAVAPRPAAYVEDTPTEPWPAAVAAEDEAVADAYEAAWWDETVAAAAALGTAGQPRRHAEPDADRPWDPVPVPRPTYQLKSPAPGPAAHGGRAHDPAHAAGGSGSSESADWEEIGRMPPRRRAVND